MSITLEGLRLDLPLSHDLPAIRARLPDYSSALGRLAALVHTDDPDATLVDIGANIGDTVAIVRGHAPLRMVCIEPSDAYFALLTSNVGHLDRLWLIRGFVSDENESRLKLAHGRGSARALTDSDGTPTAPLSKFMEESPREFREVRVVKIDTDGMDGLILRGSAGWLAEHTPVLLFEYDPSLWKLQGDRARDIFGLLNDLGYHELMFYDNQGDFLLTLRCSDSAQLDDLDHWVSDPSRKRYFDVFAFSAGSESLRARFLEGERARLRGRFV